MHFKLTIQDIIKHSIISVLQLDLTLGYENSFRMLNNVHSLKVNHAIYMKKSLFTHLKLNTEWKNWIVLVKIMILKACFI